MDLFNCKRTIKKFKYYDNEFKNINKEIEEIKNKIINNNPSIYLTRLYEEKVYLLIYKHRILNDKFEHDWDKRFYDRVHYLGISSVISGITLTLPLLLNPTNALIFLSISIIYNINFARYVLKLHNETKYLLEIFQDNLNLSSTFSNILNVLEKYCDTLTNNSENIKNNINVNELDCVNNIIKNYLENKELDNNIPENIRLLTVKVLQDELNIDEEDDLKTLLQIALKNIEQCRKEKINLQTKRLHI